MAVDDGDGTGRAPAGDLAVAPAGGPSGPPGELVAWREWCRGLGALGEGLIDGRPPRRGPAAAEALEHLADQVLCWLGWSVLHADPGRPAFHRQNDLITQWGGPNNDNVYRHARVSPGRRYRIRGRMHACENFILAVRAGFMHRAQWGTLVEVTASDRGIGPGDDFELLVGGERADELGPGSVPLPPGALMVSIREYYFDWRAEEPAVFTIECLDADAEPRPALTGATLTTRLDEALSQVGDSLSYWTRYQDEHRAARADNSFAASERVTKGLAAARYAFCFFDLAPDEVLAVETDVPDARYWSLQLYNLDWFEPIDPAGRISSLNHRQTVVDPDGRVRVAVGATDPGTPNWLDTGGRAEGMLTLRWFWPASDRVPAPGATVVRLGAGRTGWPSGWNDVGVVTGSERAAVAAARRRHLAWRFRT